MVLSIKSDKGYISDSGMDWVWVINNYVKHKNERVMRGKLRRLVALLCNDYLLIPSPLIAFLLEMNPKHISRSISTARKELKALSVDDENIALESEVDFTKIKYKSVYSAFPEKLYIELLQASHEENMSVSRYIRQCVQNTLAKN